MRAKTYIETTIPSYLAALPSRNLATAAHQQLTRDWWEDRRPVFDLYVSEPVLEEAAAGDRSLSKRRLDILANIPLLALTDDALRLAQDLVFKGSIPPRAAADALHIAIATSYACDFLLTWNCGHIANAEIQRAGRLIVKQRGLELPILCTPEELMGAGE